MREDEIRSILADVCKELDWRAGAQRCAAPTVLGASLLVACGSVATKYGAPVHEDGGGSVVSGGGSTAGGSGAGAGGSTAGGSGAGAGGSTAGGSGAGAGGSHGETSASQPELCTPGDSSQRVVFTVIFGGGTEQASLGSNIMWDNGEYFLIDEGCRYWVYEPSRTANGWGTAWSGTLSSAQAQAFASSFRLRDWVDWNGRYVDNGCIGCGDVHFWWSGQVRSNEGGMGKHDDTVWLQDVVTQIRADLESTGTAWGGDIRYAIADAQVNYDSDSPPFEHGNVPVWPLAVSLGDVALTASDHYAGNSHLATGDDANQLRALRNQCFAGVIGAAGWSFIPIQQPDGKQYALYARDSIPLEDDQGYLVLEGQ